MGEILAVTWSPDRLELRQASSEGVWQPYAPPDKTIDLNRPTRSARLSHADSGSGLGGALQQLFKDIEITLPIWFLLPPEWVQRIMVFNPQIESPEMHKAHLLWEVGQRLSGDISNYITLLPEISDEPKLELLTTRKDIVHTITSQIKKSGIGVVGISAEPDAEEQYSFEIPNDFRDAVPVDSDSIPTEKPPVSVPPVVSIGIGAAIVIAAVVWLGPFDSFFKKAPGGSAKEKAATETVQEQTTPADQVDETAKEPETPTEKKPDMAAATPTPQVAAGNLSPVHELSTMLPQGSTITLAVLSSADLKIEVAGLGDANALLNRARQSANLRNLKLAKTYSTDAGKVSLLRIEKPGWNTGNAGKDLNVWTQRATTSGLKAKGRTAVGTMASALRLIDTYWAKPAGFAKLYLAPEGGQWRVTIQ